jgi:hypothetical protein
MPLNSLSTPRSQADARSSDASAPAGWQPYSSLAMSGLTRRESQQRPSAVALEDRGRHLTPPSRGIEE